MDSGPVIGLIVILTFVVGFAIMLAQQTSREKLLQEAQAAYRESLRNLKASPTNADLKERALFLGRKYSQLTRAKGSVTVFDEVALMNDINAACAGGQQAEKGPLPAESESVELRLSRLTSLRDKGLISSEEYDSKRNEILGEL